MSHRATIGIVVENGTISRVVTDHQVIQKADVVVIEDDVPSRLLFPHYDNAVANYLKECAARSACHGLGLAAEIASEALLEMSRTPHTEPIAALRTIERIMAALADSVKIALEVEKRSSRHY